jgi:hypothetical protein
MACALSLKSQLPSLFMALASWMKVQFLQQKGPEHLLKKLDHTSQGRDNACPLLLKHLDHTNQERDKA